MRGSVLAVLLSLAAAGASGQPRLAPLPIDAALSERGMGLYSGVRLSPDGGSVAYTICDTRRVVVDPDPRYRFHSRTGVWKFGLGCDVWVSPTGPGEARNLTGAQGNNWAPNWSPDGRLLAFYSDRSGSARLWVWTAATGQLRPVSDAIVRPWGISMMFWMPDSRGLVVPLLPEGMTLEQAASLVAEAPKDTSPQSTAASVTVFEFRPGAPVKGQAGAWTTEFQRSDLGVIDVASGSVRRLVKGEKPAGFWLSPDGATLAYGLNRGFVGAGNQQVLFDISVVATAGGRPRMLAPGVALTTLGMNGAWSPDSRTFVYATTSGDVWAARAAGGAATKLNAAPMKGLDDDDLPSAFFDDTGQSAYVLSDDAVWRLPLAGGGASVARRIEGRQIRDLLPGRLPGETLLVVRREDTLDEGLYALSLSDGASRKLWEGPWSAGRDAGFRVSARPSGIVFARQSAAQPEDLWSLASGASEPRRVTHINPQFDEYVLGQSRLVDWLDSDGHRLRGALLLPAGYREGERYPTVAYIYNSSNLSRGIHSFGMRGYSDATDNFQLLATRGYAVFLPDAPSDRRDQMRDLPKTVLPGVNRVVELGIADPARLGVMGHSNGGYSTIALITLTTRFRAAVMRAGLANFVSFYGELGEDGTNYGLSVAETAFHMGTPWTDRSRYIENSPVFHLDRVETPLLIVHGSRDDAVSAFLAEEIFVDLRRLGKEVVYARYEGEGHMIDGYANQVDYVTRMIAWFDEHLKTAAASGAPAAH